MILTTGEIKNNNNNNNENKLDLCAIKTSQSGSKTRHSIW